MKKQIFIAAILISTVSCFGQKQRPLSLESYLKNHKMNYVLEVQSNKDTLSVYGYNKDDDSSLSMVKIKLDRYQFLKINEWSWFFSPGHFNPLPISLATVPFKIRPGLDEFETSATSGITNFGLNLDIGRWKTEKYFASGKKSTHKVYGGIWIAPSVQELDSIQTRGFIKGGNKDKQLFMSAALTLNYSYNNLTFTFVPVGFDLATSTVGKEWVYNKRRWWGFGIGIEPKFLNSIANDK